MSEKYVKVRQQILAEPCEAATVEMLAKAPKAMRAMHRFGRRRREMLEEMAKAMKAQKKEVQKVDMLEYYVLDKEAVKAMKA